MSTNPFRQINPPQNYGSSSNIFAQIEPAYGGSDDDGLRFTSKDLSVDTKVPPGSFDRHVSFASPPVNSTMSAVSYPSSPESARSPPIQYGQPIAPYTPDYRTAMQSDPFEDLRQESGEDRTLQQALQNAQNNLMSEQHVADQDQHDAVRNTLNRFASGPRIDASTTATHGTNHPVASRQSMDVDAFKRLLLTGDSGQDTSSTTHLSSIQPGSKGVGDSGYGSTDTASISQSSFIEPTAEQIVARPNDQDGGSAPKSNPPPAPAPRRGKSVKAKTSSSGEDINVEVKARDELEAAKHRPNPPAVKKPPPPPLARRHSHKTASLRSEDRESPLSSKDIDPFVTTDNPQTPKAPPPPPLRRSGTANNNEPRRISYDLAPTAEESESDYEVPQTTSISTRKSSDVPPVVSRSRNSSVSISTSTKRSSAVGPTMTPPPLPPPRRGRGSSRSSFDSFRPNMTLLMDYDGANKGVSSDQLQYGGDDSHRRVSAQQDQGDMSTFSPINASNILAELANLQREVDAARRGA